MKFHYFLVATVTTIAGCGDKFPDCADANVLQLAQQVAQETTLKSSEASADKLYRSDPFWVTIRQQFAMVLPGGTAGWNMLAPEMKSLEFMSPFLDTSTVRVELSAPRAVEKRKGVGITVCEGSVAAQGAVRFGLDESKLKNIEMKSGPSVESASAMAKLDQLESGTPPAAAPKAETSAAPSEDNITSLLKPIAESSAGVMESQGRKLEYDSKTRRLSEVLKPVEFPGNVFRYTAQFAENGAKLVVQQTTTPANVK